MASRRWRFSKPSSRPERTNLVGAAAPAPPTFQLGSAVLVIGIEAWLVVRWLRSRGLPLQQRATFPAAKPTNTSKSMRVLEPRSVDDTLRATTPAPSPQPGDTHGATNSPTSSLSTSAKSQGPGSPVVVYTTSISGVRKTYTQCKALCSIFRNLGYELDERDVAMSEELRNELRERLPDSATTHAVPRVFIGDRYLGGYDEVTELNETGQLLRLLKGQTLGLQGRARATSVCDACGNFRFVPCRSCHGRGRTPHQAGAPHTTTKCSFCNENGLTRCSSCDHSSVSFKGSVR